MEWIGDSTYVLFLVIVIWLAVRMSDDDQGGGKRARVPI